MAKSLFIGVYITFRVLAFPDLTVDGSFPLGGAVAAILIINGVNPWLATLAALGAGLIAGLGTSLLNTKLRINALLAGILMMVGLYSINLMIMGRANIPLLREVTIFDQFAQLFNTHTSINLAIIFVLILAAIILTILNIPMEIFGRSFNCWWTRGLTAFTPSTRWRAWTLLRSEQNTLIFA